MVVRGCAEELRELAGAARAAGDEALAVQVRSSRFSNKSARQVGAAARGRGLGGRGHGAAVRPTPC
jgi:hypothetical protein